jgi:hypothetical protein
MRPESPGEVTVTRGEEEWVFVYSQTFHALQLSQYRAGGERRFHWQAIRVSVRWDEVPLPESVKAEALELFCSRLRVIRAWPEAAG